MLTTITEKAAKALARWADSPQYQELQATEKSDKIAAHAQLAAELATLKKTSATELARLEPLQDSAADAATKSRAAYDKALEKLNVARGAVWELQHQTSCKVGRLERELVSLADTGLPVLGSG